MTEARRPGRQARAEKIGVAVKARIGIADTGREVEVEVEDRTGFMERLEQAHRQNEPILWFTDVNGADLGVPLRRIAYIELVDEPDRSVGFSP